MSHTDFRLSYPFEQCRNWSGFEYQTASGTAELNRPRNRTSLNFGKNKTLGRREVFLKFNIEEIPHHSLIRNAEIILRAKAAYSANNADIACLEPDGKWEVTYNNTVLLSSPPVKTINTGIKLGGSSSGDLGGMRISDSTVPANVYGQNDEDQITEDTSINLSFAYNDVRDGLTSEIRSIGQIIKIDTTSASASRLRVRLREIGSGPPGTGIWGRVYSVDPTTFEIDTAVDWSTDTLSYGSIGGTYSSYNLTYSAQSVTSGQVKFCEYEEKFGVPFSNSNYIQTAVMLDSGSSGLDDDEIIAVRAPRGGFGIGGYPSRSDVPFLYSGNSGTNILTQPHNSIVTVPFNASSAAGDEIRFNVTQILQEWVNSKQYKDLRDHVVGFVINPADHIPSDTVLQFESEVDEAIRLEVDFVGKRVFQT